MTHHRRGLRRLLKDDELVSAIEADFLSANIDGKQTAMLQYAIKLTVSPSEMLRQDVDALRHAGFTDVDILHIAETTAYYAYVNRIADGLGVELETE